LLSTSYGSGKRQANNSLMNYGSGKKKPSRN
jgi:hypothetical protein